MYEETSPLLGSPQLRASGWTPSVLTYLVICNFLLAGSGAFIGLPLIRLIEDNLCRRYIQQGSSLDERLCKTDQIQSELAYLNGSLLLVEALVGLVVAFPFGVLADRIGHKPIILLSTVGSQLALAWELAVIALQGTISVKLILTGPLFNVVGGGSTVQVASLYSIASDLSVGVFLMVLASLAGASVGPAISSKLMEIFSPWIPAILGFFTLPIGLSALIFIPESFPPLKRDGFSEHDDQHDSEEQPQCSNTFKSHLDQSLHLLKSSFATLKSISIIVVLATFLTRMPEHLATSQFFAQYISKRFDWPLAKTGYLLTVRGIIHLVVLSVALPWLSKLLLRKQRPESKDLALARFSAALAAVGALGMAASQIRLVLSGLVLQSLGAGLAPLCRSLAISYVAPQDTSKLNTLIGIVETISLLFAGPALAWLFEMGMNLGGLSLGLPYLSLAGPFLLCLVGLLYIHVPSGEDTGRLGEDLDGDD
ncbi:major facilitator superfamily domain-containing protein [Aspergillus novoparasiticus]|uniref:Major facilitator superfamily domain-containing protein n=1 Tax=Aspergillus novoparasiticus TaxID=986946 RepID=A0A5N6F2E1_9EURO|nr:major facilitator superfamily domain-containing protein [Aspergillus novoparasiticus]